MNKRTKLGYVIAEYNGYRIRAILNHGKDSGKMAVYAGKKKVSEEHTINKANIDKLLIFIKKL
jgi:hypothetical protein